MNGAQWIAFTEEDGTISQRFLKPVLDEQGNRVAWRAVCEGCGDPSCARYEHLEETLCSGCREAYPPN